MTDRWGGTSCQGESCILCGGGFEQLKMAGRVYAVTAPEIDFWICTRCWESAELEYQARLTDSYWRRIQGRRGHGE